MATYEMRLAPDPSSPTGFSLQYVYVPSTPVERAQAQIGEIARGLGRQLGLTGRYIAEGTAGTVGIVTNPLAAMGAAATGDMRNFVPLQEQVSRGLTALGVPEPRGAVEQSVAGLSRAVAGAGGVAGAARAAIPLATGAVGRGTITELAAMPGRQLAAGATSEGARQLAEAGGAGPIGQTLAAVGGGAIPFAGAPTTAASLVDDLSAAYRPGSVVRSGAGPVPPPPPRRPSPFDYRAVEAANPQPRPFEIAEPLPAPATYDEAIQQVADLRAQLADADRNVRLSTSIQNPARAGLRSLDQRAVLERQLAAAEGHLARLRPAAPERQNAPGTSEAARAYLERLGMGRVADLGSTRAAAPEPFRQETNLQRADRQGYTVPAFHATRADFPAFSKGDLGFHFGTADQANTRLDQTRARFGVEGENIIPVRLRLQKTLEMPDVGDWISPSDVARELLETPWAQSSRDRYKAIDDLWMEAARASTKYPDAASWNASAESRRYLKRIQDMLKADGYDSIRYRNAVESNQTGAYRDSPDNEFSYIVFDPQNVRSTAAAFDPAQTNSPDLLAMQRGQRPPGDINAQTQALLGAIEGQAQGLPERPGAATFRTGQALAPDDPRRRTRPRAPEPLGPVQAQETPPRVMQKAKRAGYAGQAIGEAVEYLAAAAKGLRMDIASRMQRARDLGFNTDLILYHGTGFDFSAFDIARGGRLTGAPSARKAIWLSTNPDAADLYAVRQMSDVLEEGGFNRPDLRERLDRREITRDQFDEIMRAESVLGRAEAARKELRRIAGEATNNPEKGLAFLSQTANTVKRLALGRDPAAEAGAWFDEAVTDYLKAYNHPEVRQAFIDAVVAERRAITFQQRHAFTETVGAGEGQYAPNTFKGGAQIIPAYVRLRNPKIVDQEGEFYRETSFNDLIDQAIAEGHDGLIVRNTYDPFAMDAVAVFDPANIRSVHAAFDPDAADSSNLLAGISGLAAPAAGLGAAGAMAAGGGQERERQPRTD